MLRYLSADWLAAAAERLGSLVLDPPVEAPGLAVVSRVIDVPVAGTVDYRISLVGSAAELVDDDENPAQPTIRFTQTYETAAAVAQGLTSAQAAFMAGDIRLGGDVTALIANAGLIGQMGDALADLRALTEFD